MVCGIFDPSNKVMSCHISIYTYRHALHPGKELSMKTEKQRKLIVRIGAAILAGLMILSALSAVLFS